MLTRSPSFSFGEIGQRLRAHRIGRGYAPEELAARLGISRAALYRVEKGEISKIDRLDAIAVELGVSLPSLLGVGIEYISNAVAFFERMRQLEESCEQIIGLFSPVSYLLTSDNYDAVLRDVLGETANHSLEADQHDTAIAQLLTLLKKRKEAYRRDRPQIASIVSALDIERLLRHGLEGRSDLPPAILHERRRIALEEVRHITGLFRQQAIGVQLGLAREPFPATSFQISRKKGEPTLTISPFRLGQQPNIHIGVGLVTTAPEALTLHEGIARRLWDSALKGSEAADHLEALIGRFGVAPESHYRDSS